MSANEADSETWSTKEVIADFKVDIVKHLDKQDITLATISTNVDKKADKSDLLALSSRIDGQGRRITSLEDLNTAAKAIRRSRNRMLAVAGVAGGIAATLVGALIEAHAF